MCIRDRAVAETYMYRMWMVYENDYLQYELGLMDEDIWIAKLASMRNIYSRCNYREITERALSFSSADLLILVDDTNISPCE